MNDDEASLLAELRAISHKSSGASRFEASPPVDNNDNPEGVPMTTTASTTTATMITDEEQRSPSSSSSGNDDDDYDNLLGLGCVGGLWDSTGRMTGRSFQGFVVTTGAPSPPLPQ